MFGPLVTGFHVCYQLYHSEPGNHSPTSHVLLIKAGQRPQSDVEAGTHHTHHPRRIMSYFEAFFGDLLQLQLRAVPEVLASLDEAFGDCAVNDGLGEVAETINSEVLTSFRGFVSLQFDHYSRRRFLAVFDLEVNKNVVMGRIVQSLLNLNRRKLFINDKGSFVFV